MSRAMIINVQDSELLRFMGASKHLQEMERGIMYIIPEMSCVPDVEVHSFIPIEIVDLTQTGIIGIENNQVEPVQIDMGELKEDIQASESIPEIRGMPKIKEICIPLDMLKAEDVPRIKEIQLEERVTEMNMMPIVEAISSPGVINETDALQQQGIQLKGQLELDFSRKLDVFIEPASRSEKADVTQLNKKMLGNRKRTKSLPPAGSTSRIRFKEYFVMTEEEKEKVKK
jgi:hypothetical protein